MTNEVAVALLAAPLPASVWLVTDAVADAIPATQRQLRHIVRWSGRYATLLIQLVLISLAKQLVVAGGAGATIESLLDVLFRVGAAIAWAGGLLLLTYLVWQLYDLIKSKLKAGHHLADL